MSDDINHLVHPDDYFNEEYYDEEPPSSDPFFTDEEWAAALPLVSQGADGSVSQAETSSPAFKITPKWVLSQIAAYVAALNGLSFKEVADKIMLIDDGHGLIRGALEEDHKDVLTGAIEVIVAHCGDYSGGQFRLADVRHDQLRSAQVQSLFNEARQLVSDEAPAATSVLSFLLESLDRQRMRATAATLVSALEGQATLDQVVKICEQLEPKAVPKAAVEFEPLPTLSDLRAMKKLRDANNTWLPFASGLPSLDEALSPRDDDFAKMGSFHRDTVSIVGAMTGAGKTSFNNLLMQALSRDLINQGFPWAKVLFGHTEEDTYDRMVAAKFDEGQEFGDMDNVYIVRLGMERARLAVAIYKAVAVAAKQAAQSGLPITEFLPHAVVVDYLQQLGGTGEDVRTATARTADLLLAIAQWDIVSIERFSGVSYEDTVGTPWPEGQEDHRTAVIGYAQLRKVEDPFYSKGKDMLNFTFEGDADDERFADVWIDPDGNAWAWEVRNGDQRLLTESEVYGASEIVKHATTLLFLHRSVVKANKAVTYEDGSVHLQDQRGAVIINKSRFGSRTSWVPMRFDTQQFGPRAQFFDASAEANLRNPDPAKQLAIDPDTYKNVDCPLIPLRPVRDPLSKVDYRLFARAR